MVRRENIKHNQYLILWNAKFWSRTEINTLYGRALLCRTHQPWSSTSSWSSLCAYWNRVSWQTFPNFSGKSLGKNNISVWRSLFIVYTVIFFKWPNNEVKLPPKLYNLLHLGLLQNLNMPQSLYRQSDGFRSSIVYFIFWCIRSVIRNQSEIKLHVHYQITQSNKLVSSRDKQSLSTCTTHAKPL